jgi:broad specificity phosphatase PhoE
MGLWIPSDLTVRLEPVIFELERCQEDLLIIGHASVIRCLVRQTFHSVELFPHLCD